MISQQILCEFGRIISEISGKGSQLCSSSDPDLLVHGREQTNEIQIVLMSKKCGVFIGANGPGEDRGCVIKVPRIC